MRDVTACKYRALLVPDVGPPRSRPWAWYYRCDDMRRFAPPEIAVDVLCHDDFTARYRDKPGDLAAYDGVLSMSWTMSPLDILRHARRSVCLVTCGGILFERRRPADWRSLVVTASRNAPRARERLPRFSGCVAVNREVYQAAKAINPGTVLIPSGVNTDFWCFKPPNPARGRFVVGWCGQRRANMKGREEILGPLMARLSGPEWQWRVNDRNFDEALAREEMRDWYHGLDVLVSTSVCEGTPSGPFEAAACGRPFLSTDVGVVADWQAAHALGLVAPAYRNRPEADATVAWFARRLEELRADPRLPTYGAIIRESVEASYSYDRAGIARRYLEFTVSDCG